MPVLPVLSDVRQRDGEESARVFFRDLRGLSLIVLSLVTGLGILSAPWLVELFASGYHKHPGQFERTVYLTRLLFPYIFLIGTAALGVAALNTHRRFRGHFICPGPPKFIADFLRIPSARAIRKPRHRSTSRSRESEC